MNSRSFRINFIQNKLLMSENLHTQFDQYLFSINSDVSILELVLIITNTVKGQL